MKKLWGWVGSGPVNGRMGLGQLSAMQERVGGLAGWLLRRLRGGERMRPRLAVLERVALGPRQSLALVEADGRRLLVATASDGGPAFFPLHESARRVAIQRAPRLGRVS
jgi:flagellar biogenesis protein FliO